MQWRSFPAVALLAVCLSSTIARAEDAFTRNSIPNKWLGPVMPEDLPDLQYPSYYNDLEKAEMEAFSGRYKKSLQTLMKLNGESDPVRVAMVKSVSLNAIGKKQKAIEVVSDPAVAKDPKIQVQRATLLAELGRTDEAL